MLFRSEIITPLFKDYKSGSYKVVGIYAKRARGKLSRYIIKNRLNSPEELKSFTDDGYRFNSQLTQGNEWVFSRNQES